MVWVCGSYEDTEVVWRGGVDIPMQVFMFLCFIWVVIVGQLLDVPQGWLCLVWFSGLGGSASNFPTFPLSSFNSPF